MIAVPRGFVLNFIGSLLDLNSYGTVLSGGYRLKALYDLDTRASGRHTCGRRFRSGEIRVLTLAPHATTTHRSVVGTVKPRFRQLSEGPPPVQPLANVDTDRPNTPD